MGVYVFSDCRNIQKIFPSLQKPGRMVHGRIDELDKKLKRLSSSHLVYVDVSSLSDPRLAEVLGTLSEKCTNRFGIIDPGGRIDDPAELFHRGAADYIGPEMTKAEITRARMESALTFSGLKKEPAGPVHANRTYVPSGRDWSTVTQGKEYTFFLMYTELDGYAELKDRLGEAQVRKLLAVHRRYTETMTGQVGGRLWMWNEPGGLILFPFDGEGFEPVVTCIRLMLNKKIFNVEMIGSTVFYSYRIALHLGSTVYKEKGQTGQIVSDAVNYIFHFGQRSTEPGGLYITGEVHDLLPVRVKQVFLPAGSYEQKSIFKYKLPRNL
jgi:class 3 adenylate cyclase